MDKPSVPDDASVGKQKLEGSRGLPIPISLSLAREFVGESTR